MESEDQHETLKEDQSISPTEEQDTDPNKELDVPLSEEPISSITEELVTQVTEQPVVPLTHRQVAEIKEVFDLFDSDGTGSIPSKDIGFLIRAVGHNPTEAELSRITTDYELSADGRVTYEEFLDIMTRNFREAPTTAQQLIEAFKVFDADQDGLISTAELRHAMTTLGERLTGQEVDEMIRIADDDGDGIVNYLDFVQLLTSE